jgi:tetratricopeptide (TPR) repeat protein
MLPGPDRIIQCPYCENQFRQRTLMSGNTFGATFWTDGKREAPMLPDSVIVSFCEECGRYFWVEDAEQIDKVQPDAEEYPDAELLKELTLEQYIEAFEKMEIKNDEDILFLLKQIWWKYNDYYRNDEQEEIKQSIEKRIPGLLEKLMDYLDENNDDHLILKGELLRELGRFEKAIEILNKINEPEYDKAKQYIIELAERSISELRELEI